MYGEPPVPADVQGWQHHRRTCSQGDGCAGDLRDRPSATSSWQGPSRSVFRRTRPGRGALDHDLARARVSGHAEFRGGPIPRTGIRRRARQHWS